ncbi:hypothetical protein MTO96_029989 [Rhipicephalus appendiculatus]
MHRRKTYTAHSERFGVARGHRMTRESGGERKGAALVCCLVHYSPLGRRPSGSSELTPLHNKMKKAAGSTRPSAKPQPATSTGKAMEHNTKQEQAAVDYSPPCTRSQPERFANQVKTQLEWEERRMSVISQRSHDRSILGRLENLRLSEVSESGRKAARKNDLPADKTKQAATSSKAPKPLPKNEERAAVAGGDEKEPRFKKPKDKAATKKGK